MEEMDSIDSRQQEEIDALKAVDILHDKKDIEHDLKLQDALTWLRFGMRFVSWIFVLWVIISSTLIFMLIDKLDKYHP